MIAAAPGQLPLPLPAAASCDLADLIEDVSNRDALAWLRRPAAWPGGRLAIWGPPATGKTHMLRGFAAAHGWSVLDTSRLRDPPPVPDTPGVVLDEADRAGEEVALLHLLNLCAERGQGVLLSARAAPARWPVALADLRSRLAAITAVAVSTASDTLLARLLRKHLADRQLRVSPALQAWALARLPREAAAVAEAVARLDRAALAAGGPPTRALATRALAELLVGQDGTAAGASGALLQGLRPTWNVAPRPARKGGPCRSPR